jgi:hypothetical protein
LKKQYKALLNAQEKYISNNIISGTLGNLHTLFQKEKITAHEPLKSFIVNILISMVIQPVRSYLVKLGRQGAKDPMSIFSWIIAGYEELYTEPPTHITRKITETYSNGGGDEKDKNDAFDHGGYDGAYYTDYEDGTYIDADGNVVETFGVFKKIIRMFKIPIKIAKFLLNIIKVLTNPSKLIKLVLYLFQVNIKFLIAGVLVIVAVVETYIYFLLTSIIAGALLLVAIVVFIVYTLVMIILIYLIMEFDIEIFDGKCLIMLYSWIISTENDITHWKTLNSFEVGNKVDRPYSINACAPCTENYKPTDFYCERLPYYLPRYSPHANVTKIIEGGTVIGLTEPGKLTMDLKFLMKPMKERKRITRQYNKDVDEYNKSMHKNMEPYDNNMKHICRSIGAYGLSVSDKKKVARMCFNTYCQNGRYASLCSKLNAVNSNQSLIAPTSIIDNYIFLIGFLAICVFILLVVYYMVYITDKKDIMAQITRVIHTVNSFFNKVKEIPYDLNPLSAAAAAFTAYKTNAIEG